MALTNLARGCLAGLTALEEREAQAVHPGGRRDVGGRHCLQKPDGFNATSK